MTARIVEVFRSLQGEGIRLGEPMTFVRFCGCNLECDYCDTGDARDEAKASELSVDQLVAQINGMAHQGEYVSLTGGEPLLWADFIAGIGPTLKAGGYKLYLETNGTLPRELSKVVPLFDAVAMDIKPPSACGKDLWTEHETFLSLCKAAAFVKLVVSDNTVAGEVEQAARLAARVRRDVPFILQPAGGAHAPDMQTVRKYRAIADRHLARVSIIAQMHKILGLR
jgi:7-carboxy-7-deazaguanine synthase